MKSAILLACATGLLGASTTFTQAAGKGTEILHFMVRSPVWSAGASPLEVGSVNLSQNRQGQADNQRFRLELEGLTPGTTNVLWIAYLGDTNRVEATTFVVAADGSANLDFMKVGSSLGKGKGKGHQALPTPLDPLARVRELVVTDASTQALAQATIDGSSAVTYLVSRNLARTGVDADASGSLRIKAGRKGGDLRVPVAGLEPGAASILWLDGTPFLTKTNDGRGVVQFTGALPLADTLTLRTIAVSDAATNLVLTTTLP